MLRLFALVGVPASAALLATRHWVAGVVVLGVAALMWWWPDEPRGRQRRDNASASGGSGFSVSLPSLPSLPSIDIDFD